MYEDYKIFGPYFRKDGRQHIIVVKDGVKSTISYPKFLVESYLGRKLSDQETIDHIDGNFLNNDFKNLRIVERKQHAKDDSLIVVPIETNCPVCGRKVIVNSSREQNRGKLVGFCSKKCSGLYGKLIQTNKTKIKRKLEFKYEKSKLSALSEMVNVEDLKFGEGLTSKVDADTEPSSKEKV